MRKATTILAILLLAGCAGNINPARQNADAILAQQVRDAINSEASLRGQNITVNAASGDITLTGVVGSALQRERAEELTRSVGGVMRVENLLSVR